jgi:hypothetical protein
MKMTASLLPATQPAGPMRLAAVLFSVPRTVPVRHCDRRMAYVPPPNAALSFVLQAKPEERKFPENFKKRLVFVEAAGPPRSTAIGRGAPSLTHSVRLSPTDQSSRSVQNDEPGLVGGVCTCRCGQSVARG